MPNIQTGAVYSPSLIASFAFLARKHGIALIMDETYRDFILDDVPHHLFSADSWQHLSILPSDWSWRNHFIHLFSFSKSYCIPGHRLGAIVAGQEVLEQIKTVLDCLQICPPSSSCLILMRNFGWWLVSKYLSGQSISAFYQSNILRVLESQCTTAAKCHCSGIL